MGVRGGEPRKDLPPRTGNYWSGGKLAWSSDSQWLAGSSGSATVIIWERETWKEAHRGDDPGGWGSLSLHWEQASPRLSFVNSRGIRTWDATTRKEALVISQQFGSTQIRWSPDGKWMASNALSSTISLKESESSRPKYTTLQGHTDSVREIGWSTNSRRLVSTGMDGMIKLWDPETGQELLTLLGHGGIEFHSVAFSPDDRRLAVGQGRTLRIWDAGFCDLKSADPQRQRLVPWAAGPDNFRKKLLGGFLFSGSFALAILVLPYHLVYWAMHSPRRRMPVLFHVVIAFSFAAISCFMLSTWPAETENYLSPFTRPFKVMILDNVTQAVMAIPLVLFPLWLITWVVKREWRRLIWLTALFLLFCMLVAVATLSNDPDLMDPLTHYSWRGWYMIFFSSAYTSSFVILCYQIVPSITRLWRWATSGRRRAVVTQ